MQRKIFTAPTSEPLSLSEIKQHLRLDSVSMADDIGETQVLAPGAHAVNTYTGAGVEVLGYRVVVLLDTGTCTGAGTIDVHLEDSPDNVTYTDWGTAFTQVTSANDNAVYEKEYTGEERYLRVVSVVGTAECSFSVMLVKDSPYAYDEAKLSLLGKTARQFTENYIGRALMPQTWEFVYDTWPDEPVSLPLPPLRSVTSITYYDPDDTAATVDATTYYVDTYSEPGRICLDEGETWPSYNLRPHNAVIIKAVCGYADADSIPEPIMQAMLLLVGHWYENRELALDTGAVPQELPFAYRALVAPYCLWWF